MGVRGRGALAGLAVGLLLLSYPLLNVPNRAELVAGVPVLYTYVFLVWLLGIVAAWLLSRSSDPPDAPTTAERAGQHPTRPDARRVTPDARARSPER